MTDWADDNEEFNTKLNHNYIDLYLPNKLLSQIKPIYVKFGFFDFQL